MFRRRARDQASLDRDALEHNCTVVIAELAEDLDWRLPDPRAFVRRVARVAGEAIGADPAAAADGAALRRILEREACAEYFADLYDALVRGGSERTQALTELFRPEEQETPDGPRAAYRGYLYRAAMFYVRRWTGRTGWAPPPEMVEELAHQAAEEVLMALLRSVDLREGRRAFWSYLSRAVERRAIDQLRALSRRQSTVSLDEMTERSGYEVASAAFSTGDAGSLDGVASTGELPRLMDAARLSTEERFSLVAGAYGLNDTEAAMELARRIGRSVTPPDIRRWRFRGRDKLRRAADLGEVRAESP